MIRKLILPAVLIGALSGPAFASDDSVLLNEESNTKIRAMLTEQGYEVAKVKLDDGKYEAYARKDGERYEIYIDAGFNIIKVERDD